MKSTKKYMALILTVMFALIAAAFVTSAAISSGDVADYAPVAAVYAAEQDGTQPAEAADQGTEQTAEADATSGKAIAAGVAIGLATLGGAIGMGLAIANTSEGISRQPEASGNIRSSLMLGLVFIETVVIYALIVSILLIFVL